MRKKLIIMVVVLAVTSSFVAHAVTDMEEMKLNESIISPMYLYINDARATLSINSSGNATIGTNVTGTSDVTSISARIELQQYRDNSWVTIRTWNESSSSRTLRFSDTYSVSSGYSYRVRSTVTAYSGQNSEGITVTSGTQSY